MGLLGEAASSEKLRGLGFLDIPGAFSVVGESARVGDAKVLEPEDQDKVAAAAVIPEEAETLPEEGMLLQYFFGRGWTPVFAGGFGKNGWLDVVFWW
jgi:hypothetical protein